jgi:hypothetical protein
MKGDRHLSQDVEIWRLMAQSNDEEGTLMYWLHKPGDRNTGTVYCLASGWITVMRRTRVVGKR